MADLCHRPRDAKRSTDFGDYPNRDGRIANGVGLVPQSVFEMMHELQQAGYETGPLPATSADLIEALKKGQPTKAGKGG